MRIAASERDEQLKAVSLHPRGMVPDLKDGLCLQLQSVRDRWLTRRSPRVDDVRRPSQAQSLNTVSRILCPIDEISYKNFFKEDRAFSRCARRCMNLGRGKRLSRNVSPPDRLDANSGGSIAWPRLNQFCRLEHKVIRV